MTKQELFDTVATHLLTQREKSGDPDQPGRPASCMYRDKQGRKCAIGCLIPDEAYNPLWEGRTIKSSVELQQACGIDDETLDLARSLQNVHDHDEPFFWAYQLVEVAKRHRVFPDVIREMADGQNLKNLRGLLND